MVHRPNSSIPHRAGNSHTGCDIIATLRISKGNTELRRWHIQCLLDEEDYNEYLELAKALHCEDTTDSFKLKRIIKFAKENINEIH